jgi:hypothetical protein
MTGMDAVSNGLVNVSSGRAFLKPELPTMGNIFMANGYSGKAKSVDHFSPKRDILGNPQNTKAFIWSIRIGPRWSRGPFFPLTPKFI